MQCHNEGVVGNYQCSDTEYRCAKCGTECCYAKVVILSVIVLSVIMLSFIIPSVVMLSVIMLSVVMIKDRYA